MTTISSGSTSERRPNCSFDVTVGHITSCRSLMMVVGLSGGPCFDQLRVAGSGSPSGDKLLCRKKPRKVRISLRKNRQKRSRVRNVTREMRAEEPTSVDLPQVERLTGKGDLTRHRTILAADVEAGSGNVGAGVVRAVDEAKCRPGRVISASGLNCIVSGASGHRYECTVRRMVRTMMRVERGAVVAGDRVLFQPIDREHGVIDASILAKRRSHAASKAKSRSSPPISTRPSSSYRPPIRR